MTRYRIIANGNTIYDTLDKNTYPVVKPQLQLELNNAGSLSFTVIPGHPYYNNITKMQTFVTVYKNDDEIFYGRVLRTEKSLDGQLNVDCEGGITFFLDSEMGKVEETESVEAFFTRCINSHNSQVENAKKFTIGDISINKKGEDNFFKLTDYQDTKSALESQLVGRFAGYLRVRPKMEGGHYIDYIEDYGRLNSQPVQIGVNIIDKDDSVSGENIFTILHPLGKTESSSSGEDKETTIKDLTQQDITIPNVTKNGEYLELTDKIALYGRITKTERFQNAEKPIDLLHKAEEFIIRRGTQLPATCEINLVNFNLLNPDIMDILLGDTFNNIEGFPGQIMTVGEMSLDLENPANDKIVLKNQEEINSNRLDTNVESQSDGKGLSDKLSKSKQQEAFRYKYIHEDLDREGQLILATKEIQINASEQLTSLSNKIFLTVEPSEETGEQGQFVIRAINNVNELKDGTEPVKFELDLDGIRMNATDGRAIVDGVEEIHGTALWQRKDHITAVAGKYAVDLQGNLHVIDGSNLYLGEGSASLAVYTEGNLTGGVIVDKLNDESTSTKIVGDRVDISATQLLRTGIFSDEYLTAGMIVQKINNSGNEKVKLGFYDEESLTAGVLVQKINGDKIQRASLGFYDDETLTAGVLVEKINGDTSVSINGDKVNISASQIARLGFLDGDDITAGFLVRKLNDGSTQAVIRGDRVDITATQVARLGFVKDNELTAGVLVERLNDGTAQTTIRGDIVNIEANESFSSVVGDVETQGSAIEQNAHDITLKVSKDGVINSINVSSEGVKIRAVRVDLGDYATVGDLEAVSIDVTDLMSGNATASKLVASNINVSNLEITNELKYGGYGDLKKKIINAFSSSSSSGTITISSTTLDGSAGPSVNFNIADTQFYKNGVAAVTLKSQTPYTWTNGVYLSNLGAVSATVTANLTNNKTPSGAVLIPVSIPSNPSISECYVSNFYVSNISRYGDGYDVTAWVTIKVEYSDSTSETFGPYRVTDNA